MSILVMRSEIPSGMCAMLRTAAQATIEIMLAISLTIACSRYIYYGVILRAHPVRGESHNQRNTTGKVATLVKIMNSRLENSDETFSFRKQCNYKNLLVHNHERCLSKGRALQRFWSFRKNFFFCGKPTKYEEKLRHFQLF